MSNNVWPDLNEEMKTTQVVIFVQKLIDDLEDMYEGKIKGKILQIEYESNLPKALAYISDMSKKIGVKEKTYECENTEEIKTFSDKSYKFILYTEKNYYRLFEITVSEFFPVKIYPRNTIFDDEENKPIIVDNQQEFESKIISIIRSEFVRNLIMKMLDNLKK